MSVPEAQAIKYFRNERQRDEELAQQQQETKPEAVEQKPPAASGIATKMAVSVLLILTLLLQACSSNQIVTTLDEIQTSTDIAATIVSGVCAVVGGLGPTEAVVCALAPQYLTVAATGTGACATEVATADTNAIKWQVCVNGYAQAIVPVLPAGTNPAVISALNSVGALIKSLLDLLKPAGVNAVSLAKGGVLASVGQAVVKPSMMQRHKLHGIANRAAATVKLFKK